MDFAHTILQFLSQGESFVPYDQLTKDIVVGWIESAIGEEQVQEYKNDIATQIENKKNPPVVAPPLPW